MDIKIDVDGFLYLDSDGSLTTVTELDAIEQDIRRALHTFKGEYFLDSSVGVDYINEILIKNPDSVLVSSLLKSTILARPGVISITKFNIEVDSVTRVMTVNTAIKTQEGTINYVEAL